MREIKFRAWNENYKQMKKISGIDMGIKRVFLDDELFSWWMFDHCEVMQYTGLEDMNYKEIYVGDIVEINSHKYSINFEIGSFMLVRCSDETDMYEKFENCWCDDVYPLSQFHWESNAEEDRLANCEVIGNIYENPKLMEGLK